MPTDNEPDQEVVLQLVDKHLAFQRRWQILSAAFYVAATTGMLVASSASALLAAMGYNSAAAILAAAATVLIGIEKSLLFREKWKLHLSIRTDLALLQAGLITGGLDPKSASERLGEILRQYATNLPVEPREA